MGVFTHEMEATSPLPTARVFKVFVLESDTLFPKVAPYAIKGVEYLQGSGGPGSIRKVTFAEGNLITSDRYEYVSGIIILSFSYDHMFYLVDNTCRLGIEYLKEKIDEINQDNLSYTYTVIESDLLKNIIEKISYDTKFVAAPNGGTICKITTKFYSVGDIEIKEEAIKDSLQKRARVFKAVEEYLLANPDA